MTVYPAPINNTRLGFHYFPDTLHYRESDLHTWLPELRGLGASWVVLVAPCDRSIPENFLKGLLSQGIEPVLHFQPELTPPAPAKDLALLMDVYARWGVHYAVFFDRPNMRSAWSKAAWAQNDLVERFLDRFIPLAEVAYQAGLVPVFPALQPYGDFWDTSFLRASLQGIERRGHINLLDSLVIAAWAQAGSRPLDWGRGGPESWPGAYPYRTSPDGQDQAGFLISDWYLAISRAVLGESRPMILMGLQSTGPLPAYPGSSRDRHLQRTLAMARALAADILPEGSTQGLEAGQDSVRPFSPEILSGNFWLLAAEPTDPRSSEAWFSAGRQPASSVRAFRQLAAGFSHFRSKQAGTENSAGPSRTIQHYLLLPSEDLGIAEWYLKAARPYIMRHLPTVGFSVAEAAQAIRVTALGGPQIIPEETLADLRASGCIVERINGDGTSIATQLAER